MYNLLSLVIGAVVAIMIAINGQLTSAYDLFVSAVIIHVIGTVFSLIVCLCRHQKILVKAEAPWMYLGGAIGVFTTFGNNLSYGRISMTSIVALVLFGQTVISLLIDSFGLMGMEKHPFKKTSVIGLVFALAGMLVMLQPSGGGSNAGAAMAVAASFVTGIFLVLARTVNGRLAEQAGALTGSFINHLVGLPITVLIMLFAKRGTSAAFTVLPVHSWWIYCGGILGVLTVFLYNVVVPKVASFRLTILTFVAQVFTSLVLDVLFGNGYSKVTLIGGALVAAGMLVNMISDAMQAKQSEQ